MNLKNVRDEVLAHGFDPTQFGVSRINQYINDALNIVARRVNWYTDEAAYDFNTVQGTTVYPWPTDFARGRSLRDTNRNLEMVQTDLRKIDRSPTSTGSPLYYAIDGPNIHLYPTPDGAYPMELRYWKIPAPLVNDSDVPPLPDTWQRLLWYWANKQCFSAEDDANMSQYWEQQFEKTLAEFEADVKFPTTDEPYVASGMWHQSEGVSDSQTGWGLWIS